MMMDQHHSVRGFRSIAHPLILCQSHGLPYPSLPKNNGLISKENKKNQGGAEKHF